MAFGYGRDFRVLDLRNIKDVDELERILISTEVTEEPARRVWSLLRPICRGAVIERDYIDLDFRAGFARFHYLRHRETNRRCTRIHFFGCNVNRYNMERMPQRTRDEYLGYVVLRPLPAFRLGRTLLSPRVAQAAFGSTNTYLTCSAWYQANIAGNAMRFLAVPSMEQDTLVCACASVALWTVATHMAHRHPTEFRTYFTPEITDIATRNAEAGRSMPSQGLTPRQMLFALQEMGYDPISSMPKNAREARNTTYQYVESSIPVLAVIFFPGVSDGHVVTAVGHALDMGMSPRRSRMRLQDRRWMTFTKLSDYVPWFVVQDDISGPFRKLEFIEWDAAVSDGRITQKHAETLSRAYSCPAVLDRGQSSEQLVFVQSLMVPLPGAATLSGDAAELRALFVLRRWLRLMNVTRPGHLVIRTFLERSNDIKTTYTPEARGVPARLSRELRKHLLSRWVWVVEIAERGLLQSEECILGQVLQDCSGHPKRDEFLDLLAFDLPFSVATYRPDGEPRTVAVPDWVPYGRYVRSL